MWASAKPHGFAPAHYVLSQPSTPGSQTPTPTNQTATSITTATFDKNHKFLRDRMKDTQETMALYANHNRMTPPPFHVDDRMFVRIDHICTNRTACKLAEQKIGPFPIISQPSTMSFTLRLPSTIHIHPVFHVSQLEPEHLSTFLDRK